MTTYYVRFFDNYHNSPNVMDYYGFANGMCLSNRQPCWYFFEANFDREDLTKIPTNIFKTLKALSANSLQTEVFEDVIPYSASSNPETDNLWDIGNIYLKIRWFDDPNFRLGGYRLKDWNDIGYTTDSLDNFYPKLLQKLESIKIGSSIENWDSINVLLFKIYKNGIGGENDPDITTQIAVVIYEGNDYANANKVEVL